MKIIKLTPHQPKQTTALARLIARYRKAGNELRLQFLRNNPAYNPPGLIA